MDKAIILGAGTYGRVFAEYLKEINNFKIIGFLDDDSSKVGQEFNGIRVIGKIGDFHDIQGLNIQAIFAPIGNNNNRLKLINKIREHGYKAPSFIHHFTSIPSSVKLTGTVYILPGTVIMPNAEIFDSTMISMGVNIGHDTIIREGCFLANGVNIGGSIEIHDKVFVGMSACIMTGVKSIGQNSIIGAGAVVIRDVPNGAVVIGNPAKILRMQENIISAK